MDNLYQVSVRLKGGHSGFVSLNNQRFGYKFVKEVVNPSEIELRWLTLSCIFYILVK